MKLHELNDAQRATIESWAKGTISRCLTCQTALIDDLMSTCEGTRDITRAFNWDNVTNLYPVIPDKNDIRDEWDIEQCHDFLATWGRTNGMPKLTEENTDTYEEELADYTASVAEELADDNEAQEILGWWLVSDNWVAEKLAEIGEPILDNDYGYWWGRTTSGQSIIGDNVFQNLYLHAWGAPKPEECTQ